RRQSPRINYLDLRCGWRDEGWAGCTAATLSWGADLLGAASPPAAFWILLPLALTSLPSMVTAFPKSLILPDFSILNTTLPPTARMNVSAFSVNSLARHAAGSF